MARIENPIKGPFHVEHLVMGDALKVVLGFGDHAQPLAMISMVRH
jgi:hypothetical protein